MLPGLRFHLCILPCPFCSAQIRRAALREAQILHMARRHPNIVQLLDAFQSTSGRIYLLLK